MMLKKIIPFLLVLLVSLLILGCGSESVSDSLDSSLDLSLDDSGLIVTVNDESFYQTDIDDVKAAIFDQTGQEVTDQFALEQLVSQYLLLAEAEKRNIVVSDAQVESILERTIVATGSSLEELKSQFSEEDYAILLDRSRNQLKLRRLATSAATITITDEDAKVFFEENKVKFSEDVVYEDIADQLKQQIEQGATQEILTQLLKELSSQATITYH
jgi:hypothetical protein